MRTGLDRTTSHVPFPVCFGSDAISSPCCWHRRAVPARSSLYEGLWFLARKERPEAFINKIRAMLGRIMTGRYSPTSEIRRPGRPCLDGLEMAADVAVAAPEHHDRAAYRLLPEIFRIHGQIEGNRCPVIFTDGVNLFRRGAARIFLECFGGENLETHPFLLSLY